MSTSIHAYISYIYSTDSHVLDMQKLTEQVVWLISVLHCSPIVISNVKTISLWKSRVLITIGQFWTIRATILLITLHFLSMIKFFELPSQLCSKNSFLYATRVSYVQPILTQILKLELQRKQTNTENVCIWNQSFGEKQIWN